MMVKSNALPEYAKLNKLILKTNQLQTEEIRAELKSINSLTEELNKAKK